MSSIHFPPITNLSLGRSLSADDERSYVLNWLLQLEECTKSASADSFVILKELAASIQTKPNMSDHLQNLILKVQAAVQQGDYNPKLHKDAERVYLELLQENEYDLSFWEQKQDPTPQRTSPSFAARRQLFPS